MQIKRVHLSISVYCSVVDLPTPFIVGHEVSIPANHMTDRVTGQTAAPVGQVFSVVDLWLLSQATP